jgi:hypothetical protein
MTINGVTNTVKVGAARYTVALKGDRTTQVLAGTGAVAVVLGALAGMKLLPVMGAGLLVGSIIRGYQVTQVEEKVEEPVTT